MVSKPQRRLSLKQELKRLKKNIEAKFKTKLKLYKKHPEVWIGDRLADMAKQTGVTDVAKIIAIVGMTIIVKNTINQYEDLREGIKPLVVIGAAGKPPKGQKWRWKGPFQYELVGEAVKFEGMFPDWADWLVAFALAYVLVEHFGSIMRGAGNITASIYSLLSALILGGGTAA